MSTCRFCNNDIDKCTCPSTVKKYGHDFPNNCSRCGQAAGSEARFTQLMTTMMKRGRASGNYVANKETNPTKVTFDNGRVVRIVKGALVVEWAKPKVSND